MEAHPLTLSKWWGHFCSSLHTEPPKIVYLKKETAKGYPWHCTFEVSVGFMTSCNVSWRAFRAAAVGQPPLHVSSSAWWHHASGSPAPRHQEHLFSRALRLNHRFPYAEPSSHALCRASLLHWILGIPGWVYLAAFTASGMLEICLLKCGLSSDKLALSVVWRYLHILYILMLGQLGEGISAVGKRWFRKQEGNKKHYYYFVLFWSQQV